MWRHMDDSTDPVPEFPGPIRRALFGGDKPQVLPSECLSKVGK